jgi:hypothetical protein
MADNIKYGIPVKVGLKTKHDEEGNPLKPCHLRERGSIQKSSAIISL